MDPYDLPVTLVLSSVSNLEEPSDAELDEAIQEEVLNQSHRLPLQDLCCHGGSPERGDVEISDFRVYERTADHFLGTFLVSFTESYQGACRDAILDEPQSGVLQFAFDRATYEIEIEIRNPLPSRDPDQF